MELWIRSQNREKLIKVNQLGLYDSNILKNDFLLNDKPNYYNIRIVANDNYNLGTYITKERALKVLDEIQRILQPKIIINNTSDDSLPIIDGEWVSSIKAEMNYDTKELSTVVYEMPKE